MDSPISNTTWKKKWSLILCIVLFYLLCVLYIITNVTRLKSVYELYLNFNQFPIRYQFSIALGILQKDCLHTFIKIYLHYCPAKSLKSSRSHEPYSTSRYYFQTSDSSKYSHNETLLYNELITSWNVTVIIEVKYIY